MEENEMENMGNKETTALAVLEQHKFELVQINDEIKDIIAEELDGFGTIPFDIVKIPSGGGLAFEIPGENEDTPTSVSELIGIVVDHHPVNSYWESEYNGSNNPPICSSFDGKIGINSNGERSNCVSCPYNQFGSASKGSKGKACKNMRRIYILRSGQALPTVLTLPPSSLAAWQNYIGKKVVTKGKRPWMVLTKITLKKEKNENGITYSQAVFTRLADLSPAECAHIKPLAESFKVMTRSLAMQSTEMFAQANLVQDEFVEVEAADIPF